MRELANQNTMSFKAPVSRDSWFMLLPALSIMAAVVLFLFLLLVDFDGFFFNIERPYLIPWVLATGVAIVVPVAYLKYRNEFSLVNPLVYAGLTYFFPIFFLGGWSLTFGFSYHYYLNYVSDPEYNFPLAFLCVIVGFTCLSVGFFIPHGKKAGNYVASWLPKWEFKPEEIVIASILCLAVGIFLSLLALELGQIGFQNADTVLGDTGSLNYYLTIIVPTSSFLLWVAFFQFEKWNVYHLVIGAVQIFTAIFMLIVLGGKSSLLQSMVIGIGAFVLVKRNVLLKHWIIFAVAITLCLTFGVIYGTKFRILKGNNERVSVEEYGAVAVEAITTIGEDDLTIEMMESFELLAERMEIISSLAVVVANYEALQTYEASYGLENNIWTYTWTSFIPRYLWKDKPIVADNSSYNELYFDHGGYGLAITSMGDLLRNFGPWGVPFGMIVLGFFLRVFYAGTVEGLPFSTWRSAVFFIVLTRISYDSFYGEILPTVMRITAVIFVQLFFLKTIIYALRRAKS